MSATTPATGATEGDGDDVRARRLSRRRLVGGAFLGAGAVALGGRVIGGGQILFSDDSDLVVTERARRIAAPARRRWQAVEVGRSVEGRPITMHQNVVAGARASVLVIAAVHGDERGVAPVAHELITVPIPAGLNAHVVPIANPDGWARGTRENANGVDLNRNFPFDWQPHDGGPGAASEPETRAIMDLVDRIRAGITIWIHEPLEYVAAVGPNSQRHAGAWAAASGLPLRESVEQHGGGETWAYHVHRLPSMLVEGVSRELALEELRQHRRGFEAVLGVL